MRQRVAALDIGGSGCRVAWVDVDPGGRHEAHEVHRLGSPGSLAELARAITGALGPVAQLGVSSAGFVDSSRGTVSHCRVQPWLNGPVAAALSAQLSGGPTTLINDGEAHLLAHLGSISAHPLLCFSFGTSVGFAATDETGAVRRPRSDANWEIGYLRLNTRASNPELWWALGSSGLSELQDSMGNEEGVAHFGWRVGGLLHDFATLLRPRTVVLTGGIVEDHGGVILEGVESELRSSLPAEIERPNVVLSPFGRRSALVGAAVAAVSASTAAG